MTDVIASLFVDAHPSRAKQPLFRDHNCFLIASTVSAYSPRQMLLWVVADASPKSRRHALYDHHSPKFDIVFNGIWAKTNPNMR